MYNDYLAALRSIVWKGSCFRHRLIKMSAQTDGYFVTRHLLYGNICLMRRNKQLRRLLQQTWTDR